MSANGVHLELPDELLDAIADRVLERLAAPPAPDEWLRGADAAAGYLGCPVSRVYALTSAGRIPFQKDGSALLFRRAELDEFIRNGGARRP